MLDLDLPLHPGFEFGGYLDLGGGQGEEPAGDEGGGGDTRHGNDRADVLYSEVLYLSSQDVDM